MATWIPWEHGIESRKQREARIARQQMLNARIRWKNSPLRRIQKYTRQERIHLLQQTGRIVKSCGRNLRLRSLSDLRR